jgi:hypothetical protein
MLPVSTSDAWKQGMIMNDLMQADDEMFSVDPAPESRQYLTWEPEAEAWSLQSVQGIAADFEHSCYAGYGRPHVIMLLPPDGTPPIPLTWVIMDNSADDDDYLYTTYELRDAEGTKYDRFTVKVDGRA